MTLDPEVQLEVFIDRYAPDVAALTRELLARMKGRIPGAVMLVYDNYNTLAVGFCPTEKASTAVLSIAAYPRWVRLFFLKGAGLPDPEGLLDGTGSTVRSILCPSAEMLDRPEVEALIQTALDRSFPPFDPNGKPRLIIKSISARQRPRRL